jgi:hypothetical protein
MKPRRNLAHLLRTGVKRVIQLRAIAASLHPNDPFPTRDRGLAYVLIELLNCWSSFARSLYLSCVDSAWTTQGHVVLANHRFPSVNSAIGFAVHQWRPGATPNASGIWHRRDEPTWHDPQILLRLSHLLAFSNNATLTGALSLGSRVFIDVPVTRNFFAHRNQGSQSAMEFVALQYGIAVRRPADLLLQRALKRPQALVLDWLDDIYTTMGLMCE